MLNVLKEIRGIFIVFCLIFISAFVLSEKNVLAINSYSAKAVSFKEYVESCIDYSFTFHEINSSKITDSSIRITSEYLDKEFLSTSDCIVNNKNYKVVYDNGDIVVSNLIPDFFYDSIFVEAFRGKEKYVIEIKNFKTAKSSDPLKQFISKRLQYTLRSSVKYIDYHMWEHKILMREITPEEFIYNILQDPYVLYNVNSIDDAIGRIFSAVFAQYITTEELEYWKNVHHQYKVDYHLKDNDAYIQVVKNMMDTEDFRTILSDLKMHEREIPEITSYMEFSDNKTDFRYGNQHEDFYVMDYYELNRSKSDTDSLELFLSDEFKNYPNPHTKFYISIDNAQVVYRNGKFYIENLEPSTIYEDVVIKYTLNGRTKTIFIDKIKTKKIMYSDPYNIVDLKYMMLDDLNYSMDEFIKVYYKERFNIDVLENELDDLKILFASNKHKLSNFKSYIESQGDNVETTWVINNIYDIIFDRYPDDSGIKFWSSEFNNLRGVLGVKESIKKIFIGISNSGEFYSRFNEQAITEIIKENNINKRLLVN